MQEGSGIRAYSEFCLISINIAWELPRVMLGIQLGPPFSSGRTTAMYIRSPYIDVPWCSKGKVHQAGRPPRSKTPREK